MDAKASRVSIRIGKKQGHLRAGASGASGASSAEQSTLGDSTLEGSLQGTKNFLPLTQPQREDAKALARRIHAGTLTEQEQKEELRQFAQRINMLDEMERVHNYFKHLSDLLKKERRRAGKGFR